MTDVEIRMPPWIALSSTVGAMIIGYHYYGLLGAGIGALAIPILISTAFLLFAGLFMIFILVLGFDMALEKALYG